MALDFQSSFGRIVACIIRTLALAARHRPRPVRPARRRDQDCAQSAAQLSLEPGRFEGGCSFVPRVFLSLPPSEELSLRLSVDGDVEVDAGGDRATRATTAPRIRRDLSLRKGSAREPERLPRRNSLISPCGVARGVKTDPRLAVRNLPLSRPRDDWPPAPVPVKAGPWGGQNGFGRRKRTRHR